MKKTLPNRVRACARFILFGCALLLSTNIAAAQTPRPPSADPPNRDPSQSPMGGFEDEIRAKRAIKMAEKDHEENLARAKEIADLGKFLETNLKDKTTIDRESAKKLDRLEKLTKKVRNEAGGEEEEVKIVDRPTDIAGAVTQIAKSAESLSKVVQDTPRQVVSASVIGNANVLLELIKLLRAFDTRP